MSKKNSVGKKPYVKGQDTKRITCSRGRKLEDLLQKLEQAKLDGDKIRVKMFQDMVDFIKKRDGIK